MKKQLMVCWMALAISALLFGMNTPAMADFIIQIGEDGGPLTTVASGTDFHAGGISFSGNTSSNDFTISILGASSNNGINVSSLLGAVTQITENVTASHELDIVVFQSNYTLPAGLALNVVSRVSGTYGKEPSISNQSVAFQSWEDAGNGQFGSSTSGKFTATPGFSPGGSFDTNGGTGVTNAFTRGSGNYSVTDEIFITMAGGGDMNFSDHVTLASAAVPEPATMLLLGFGLVGLGGFARKKFKK